MANSEGRKGGMNFHPRQLQREWKPKEGGRARHVSTEDVRNCINGTCRCEERQHSQFETLNKGLDDVKAYLSGSTMCEHFNEPFECSICKRPR